MQHEVLRELYHATDTGNSVTISEQLIEKYTEVCGLMKGIVPAFNILLINP